MIQSVRSGAPLIGAVQCPGDKSISHRYAMLAALAQGESELLSFAGSLDCRSTLRCLRALGVDVRARDNSVFITGNGLDGLKAPSGDLDAGNSGTTMRLLSGILAGQSFETTIAGDSSLSRRPMGRIIEPLRLMGAHIDSLEGGMPPLTHSGREPSSDPLLASRRERSGQVMRSPCWPVRRRSYRRRRESSDSGSHRNRRSTVRRQAAAPGEVDRNRAQT